MIFNEIAVCSVNAGTVKRGRSFSVLLCVFTKRYMFLLPRGKTVPNLCTIAAFHPFFKQLLGARTGELEAKLP